MALMHRQARLALVGCFLGCTLLTGCHQTFTPPDQPDLAKDPLVFPGIDLSGQEDLAIPVEHDLSANPIPDMSIVKDLAEQKDQAQ